MVDKRAEGNVGVPFQVHIERGKIAEFSRAIAAEHPDHHGGERPVVPATFLTSMFHWERGRQGANPWSTVQMSKARGMHASQEYEFFGPPPRDGDVLNAQSRIDRIFEKQGRRGGSLTFVEMVTDYRDAAGTLVARAKMTAVETAKPAGGDGETKDG